MERVGHLILAEEMGSKKRSACYFETFPASMKSLSIIRFNSLLFNANVRRFLGAIVHSDILSCDLSTVRKRDYLYAPSNVVYEGGAWAEQTCGGQDHPSNIHKLSENQRRDTVERPMRYGKALVIGSFQYLRGAQDRYSTLTRLLLSGLARSFPTTV